MLILSQLGEQYMIGTVVAWGNNFLTISTENEVYRTVDNPYGDEATDDGISLDDPVEFDVIDNRAVNLQKVFFAPNMVELNKNINNCVILQEDDDYCNDDIKEGARHYQVFGRICTRLTKNSNTLDSMNPMIKKLGVNLAIREHKPIKLNVKDGQKPVIVYDHSFEVGLLVHLTRVKDLAASNKAWSEYNYFSSQLHDKYFEICFEEIEAVRIQQKLYFGSSLSRKFNEFKYKSSKYDNIKI